MLALEVHGNMTLTKRQQQAMITMCKKGHMWPSCPFAGLLGVLDTDYFAYMTAYALMDKGLTAFDSNLIRLTPTGERLAAILAELPAPLTRRQWQILLRFRDVGTAGTLSIEPRTCVNLIYWYLPTVDSTISTTSERTIRTLCDYGLIGFEYRGYVLTRFAHLTPLGEELTSLLP